MSRGQLLSLVLLGGIAFSTCAAHTSAQPQSQAAPRYTWVNFDGQWFCRSWSSSVPVVKAILPGMKNSTAAVRTFWEFDSAGGRAYGVTDQAMTRCTSHWRIDSSMRLLSNDAAWTPNPTGEWPVANDLLTFERTAHQTAIQSHTLKAVVHRKATINLRTTTYARPVSTTAAVSSATGGTSGGTTGSTGGYNPWAPVPGHPTYSMGDFAGDPYASSFGVCTWYAWYRHQSEPLASFGSAINWVSAARNHGLSVGSQPAAGATVVFSPGVEGAGGTGHVGHVEAVLGGGWFLMSEMNFYWNGGGWGRVDYRYAYVRSGVTFIY